MIDKTLLSKFIYIGKKESFSDLKDLSPSEIKNNSYIVRLHWKDWYKVAEELETRDLINLIKALTIAENILPDWRGGSVSPVIWLYKKLYQRDITNLDEITNWILAHTNNSWSPFSNFGAKSMEEYKALKYAYERKKAAIHDAEEERKQKGMLKRVEKVKVYKIRTEQQLKEKSNRAGLLKKLNALDPIKRLCYIANDKDHKIDYYPVEYANVGADIIKNITLNVKEKLIDKIGHRKKGVWKNLKQSL